MSVSHISAPLEARVHTESRTIDATIVTYESPDSFNRANEIVKAGAFDKSIEERFAEMPKGESLIKALWHHFTWMPVGIPIELAGDKHGVNSVTKIAKTKLGDDTLELADMGIADRVSVGFNPIRRDTTEFVATSGRWEGFPIQRLLEAELLEYSFAPLVIVENAKTKKVNRCGSLNLNQWAMVTGQLTAEGFPNSGPRIVPETSALVAWADGGGPRFGFLRRILTTGNVTWAGGLELQASEEVPVAEVEVANWDGSKFQPTGDVTAAYLPALRSMVPGTASETDEWVTRRFEDLPLAPLDRSWDAIAADRRLRRWASSDGSGDIDKIDWNKYSGAHFWVDRPNIDTVAAHKLRFADVIGGVLTAVPRGIFAAAGVAGGARGGIEIPDTDFARLRGIMGRYYVKMAKFFGDEAIKAPWAKEERADTGGVPPNVEPEETRAPQLPAGGEVQNLDDNDQAELAEVSSLLGMIDLNHEQRTQTVDEQSAPGDTCREMITSLRAPLHEVSE